MISTSRDLNGNPVVLPEVTATAALKPEIVSRDDPVAKQNRINRNLQKFLSQQPQQQRLILLLKQQQSPRSYHKPLPTSSLSAKLTFSCTKYNIYVANHA